MDELENTSQELSKIKKAIPFGIPENYFDNFYERLKYNIHKEKTNHLSGRDKVVNLIRPAIRVAASLAAISLIIYGTMNYLLPGFTNSVDPNETTFIEEERIFSLIENMDESSFFTLIQESQAEEIGEEQLNNDELLSYLSCNISEYEIFLENTY